MYGDLNFNNLYTSHILQLVFSHNVKVRHFLNFWRQNIVANSLGGDFFFLSNGHSLTEINSKIMEGLY